MDEIVESAHLQTEFKGFDHKSVFLKEDWWSALWPRNCLILNPVKLYLQTSNNSWILIRQRFECGSVEISPTAAHLIEK